MGSQCIPWPSQPQDPVPGVGGENADSVLGLLKDVITCLAAQKEKASLFTWDSAPPNPFLSSIVCNGVLLDPAVPFTSLAHQAQSVGKLGSSQAQYSPAGADAWLAGSRVGAQGLGRVLPTPMGSQLPHPVGQRC